MATHHQPLLDTTPTRKTSLWKSVCLLLTAAAIIGSITLVTTRLNNPKTYNHPLSAHICDPALDRVSCWAMVSEVASGNTMQMNSVDLLQMFLKKSTSHIRDAMEMASSIGRRMNDPKEQAAMADCLELMDLSIERVMDSVLALGKRTTSSHSDAHSWLSSVLTNHEICLDGLNGPARPIMEPTLKDLIARARASLAMVVAISPPPADEVIQPLNGRFPPWVTSRDRKLLEAPPKNIVPNVVVATDGSGNYTTVSEAVDSAPKKGETRYIIYVKAGTYNETVRIASGKTNLMLVGDGMNLTIITGSLNVVDGSTTFNSATVAVVADGFIAQDICFQNTAGAQKHQAVALRVGSDQSVINRCRIDAYQDTLYAHSNRQFYRDSHIIGTVDFIFGNAAVVFQNCQIVCRLPMTGQFNTVTAQGRTDPNQNTGTSIQSCNITASTDLQPEIGTINSYLGRPWKEYAVTVVMQSYIGSLINPAGWAPWDGDFALSTLNYGEYLNDGPGAGTSQRVNWTGYHVITDPTVAAKFTVAQLIQGGSWLQSTGVTYTEGL
ncbi:hypothetical protein Vadar_025857 [Vaccinium darrowii]|uniref:Uncharacterized protein n=1 Tax=Vaccinium darrowii TaxID=229202 RepID=A0ACB7XCV7_9ERIC|nr:hypothetical protein Vadar_025857 [Vaccinium darrowii]